MSKLLIDIRGLDLKTPTGLTLAEVNLQIRAGEVVFLYGENGSGKSTLLNYIYNQLLLSGDSGVSSFNYMPQTLNREFFLPLSLREVALLDSNEESLPSNLSDILLPVRLFNKLWNTSSGGEKQRALLSQKFMSKKDLYLLDEPFNHLDESSIEAVVNFIEAEVKNSQATFLVATHAGVREEYFQNIPVRSLKFLKGKLSQ